MSNHVPARSVSILDPDDLRAAHSLFGDALLHGPADDERWDRTRPSYSPGRTLGVRDGGSLVATATSFPCSTAVPGGGVLQAAAVTRVGVRADHTRRGLLSMMMRFQLADVASRGEAVASLRASEAPIYGRFGYGVATRGREMRVRRTGRGLRAEAPAGGTVRQLDRSAAVAVLAALHERIALRRTGGITRDEGCWNWLRGPIAAREPLLAAVHTGPDGDDGFAVAFPRDGEGGFAGRVLRVEDLHAATPDATAALWRYLLDVDLVGTVEGSLRPLDEPLDLLLADPRDCTVTGIGDETWLRIVDVPAALAARTYGCAEPVLLAVHDRLLESNTGVYRIAGDGVERVGPLGAHTPHLECDVAALAMAYLGDRAPSALAAAGWWAVHEPAAIARSDTLFATPTVPWCGTFF